MREYILTDKERERIRAFLATGETSTSFRVLLHRCKNMGEIRSDMELIDELLKKVEK